MQFDSGIINAIATVTTSILTGVYVYYTRKSFLEIKKQTDYQIRAYLFSSFKTSSEDVRFDRLSEMRKAYDGSISKLLPDQSKCDTNLFIELKNRGKTDICWWKIKVCIKIEVGQFLNSLAVKEGTYSIEIEGNTSSDIIQPECSISVPVGSTGYIPRAILSWSIEYKDLHENLYKEFSGDKDYIYTNKLLFEYKGNQAKNI